MQEIQYFEAYQPGSSRTIYGRTLTETDFVVHACHTGDFFPHHMDAEFMKTQTYGQRLAHGTLVFAVGVDLTATRINLVAFSYGYDRLRFIKPVFIGDTLCTRLTITRKEVDAKRPGHGRVWELTEVLNQRNEVLLACEHIYLVQRQPPPDLPGASV